MGNRMPLYADGSRRDDKKKRAVISVPNHVYRNIDDEETYVSRSGGRRVAGGGKRRRRKKRGGGKTFLLIVFCLVLGFSAGIMLPRLWEASREEVPVVPPSGTPVDQTCLTVDTLSPESFVTNITGSSQVTVSFGQEPDFTSPGTQEVTIILTDESGSQTEIKAGLTVIQDTTPPVISGVTDQEVLLGETVAYKKGVTVTDDYDEDVELEVDSSQVNPTVAGDYLVTYRATDRSGNTAEATAYFSFTQPSEYTDLALEEAQKVLDKITTDDMTQTEVARAIYDWCRANISYTAHSDKGDWQKAAVQGFTQRSGDCYVYFATAKAMFEAAGIPNIDVEKTYVEGRAMHYWSLIDCGSGWYHFDATPRVGEGDDFFMVTDAFLEAYSQAHNNSHEFDHSLYPATPEE